MQEMKRKVLSLLLCGLLACSMLTACGGSDDSAKSGVESDVEVSKDDETPNKENDSSTSADDNNAIEPSIYTELMAGKSIMADAKIYATSHVLQFEGGSHTDIQDIYGEFIPDVEGHTILLYDTNESGNFDSNCLITEIITKVSYSSADESARYAEQIMNYLDKSFIKGCYIVDGYSRPAYIVNDDADTLTFIWIDNQYTDYEGYILTVHETNYHSKPERSCWFDEKGKAFIPEFFKAQGVGETVYNDIDEADIDISSVAVEGMSGNGGEAAAQEAPQAAQDTAPVE